jgi:starch synthase
MLKNVAKARRSDKMNPTQPIDDIPVPPRRVIRKKPARPRVNPVPVPAERRRVLMIGSEALPFAKTGGLADVLGALPPALARLGWDATVALPKYRGVDAGAILERFPVTVGGFTRDVAVHEAPLADGARAWLVDCPDLFDREAPYGVGGTDYPDNALRFAMLVRATLEFAGRQSPAPSIVHAHDWQAGLAPVYLKTLYATHPVLGGTPSVFTIHNLAYQGLFDGDWLPRLDLGWELFTLDRLEYWRRISFLKGGINYADMITTVSPRYAEEIQTPPLGFGFDGILRQRRADLVGILNAIDTTEWDPARDRYLPEPYSAAALGGKKASKAAVMARYGLSTDDEAMKRPLIGMVSRMVDQKGFDLIAALAGRFPELDASFVVLGTGEARYQDLWTLLAARFADRIGARIGFDEGLAHLIEGGADVFLMPSQFEPCGLNQMYSLRYGTVPVVRQVGGLADTVRDYGSSQKPNGFVFRDYTPSALLDALTRALTLYRDRRKWRNLQVVGMREDHSWDRSAGEYVKMYERALAGG